MDVILLYVCSVWTFMSSGLKLTYSLLSSTGTARKGMHYCLPSTTRLEVGISHGCNYEPVAVAARQYRGYLQVIVIH